MENNRVRKTFEFQEPLYKQIKKFQQEKGYVHLSTAVYELLRIALKKEGIK